jgi:hypothetical protein
MVDDIDFDWVSARCKCSPHEVFEKLKLQAEADVNKREATLTQPERQRCAFSFVPDRNRFSVLVKGHQLHNSITVGMTDTGIVVHNDEGHTLFSADVTINDEGLCKLKVDGEEKELWQVRKMALEQLFFSRY